MSLSPIAPFRMTWHRDVPDDAIAWAMHLHQSRGQVEWCLELLRASYPASRVVLISDGDDEDYTDVARAFGAELIVGEHLHALSTCHLYATRILEALARGAEPYCFKIDPDTAVRRRFRLLPAFSCVFGTLETITEGRLAEVEGAPNVQGGCIGLTNDALRAILDAGVLNEKTCAEEWRTTWARCDDMRRTAARGQFCDDYVISWAADVLSIPLVCTRRSARDGGVRWEGRRTAARDASAHAVDRPRRSDSGHSLVPKRGCAPAASRAGCEFCGFQTRATERRVTVSVRSGSAPATDFIRFR